MLYIGMEYLNFTNKWLQYSRKATYPFFFFHQPVIVFIAFYIIQWELSLLIKISIVLIASFIGSLGIYELLVRRFRPVRALFGMKPLKNWWLSYYYNNKFDTEGDRLTVIIQEN